ncbi:hypothetical protein [Lactiplantibacillus fabifermentans]|uniref:Uncharacterized protein n=1 Tax=Lactiplantibacillus fabifermentans DSM 21115 TaxID=1413187 RepID=A0A0R2NQU6_9LACO|nr:hypothetical protein [Lactiplantibacillus fabifermentans]KRO28097.1 hypothetical protein DY78_GL002679 [Lactiplantibacillus fabifermentans DSM 21115]
MPKLINTKYGYVTPQEAEMDAHLDKWMKRRAKQHGAFSLDKKAHKCHKEKLNHEHNYR